MDPVLIFDKSFLQSISVDESVWLDSFFICNIVPTFYLETLADIAKDYKGKRVPDDVVASLANKTPDINSKCNVYHLNLLIGELTGKHAVPINGQIPLSRGRVLQLGSQHGITYEESPEEEAFRRWQQKDFLNLERNVAKKWREDLASLDLNSIYAEFQKFFPLDKPKTFKDLKKRVDFYIESTNIEVIFEFGLKILDVPKEARGKVLSTWKLLQKPKIEEFAPFFKHMFSVHLFFCMAIAADLISRFKASNVMDFAYLYYLPFCNVFTSGDNLHQAVAPLFLRPDQVFIPAKDLKEDLKRINEHYLKSSYGHEFNNIFELTSRWPLDDSFLVVQISDKCFPRKNKSTPTDTVSNLDASDIMEKIKLFQEKGVAPTKQVNEETIDYFYFQKEIIKQKGSWKRF